MKEHKPSPLLENKTKIYFDNLDVLATALCMKDVSLFTRLMAPFVILFWQYCIDLITVNYNYVAHNIIMTSMAFSKS